MISFPSGEIVPSEHCREANDAYLQIRFIQRQKRPLNSYREVLKYEPWVLDIADKNLPVLAGKPVQVKVYATLCDAFIANTELFTSPQSLFRGHSISQWGLQPTIRRFKTTHATNYFASCRRRFIQQVQPLLREDFTELSFEALCQHYGIHTGLLDLTESFEVAAYFAQSDSRRGTGCIWVFDREALAQSGQFVHYSEIPNANGVNPRLLKQRGCFLRLDSEALIEQVTSKSIAVLFNQFVQGKQWFQIEEKLLSNSFLFPPDQDDVVADIARKILTECQSIAPIIHYLEQCSTRLPTEERELVQVEFSKMLKHGGRASLLAWLRKPYNLSHPRNLLLLEELVWNGGLDLIEAFLTFSGGLHEFKPGSLDLGFYDEWYNLTLAALVRKGNFLDILNSNESLAFWNLTLAFLGINYWDTTKKVLQMFLSERSPIYHSRFARNREQLLPLIECNLELLSLRFEVLGTLKTWFWNETDSAVQKQLRHLLNKYHSEQHENGV